MKSNLNFVILFLMAIATALYFAYRVVVLTGEVRSLRRLTAMCSLVFKTISEKHPEVDLDEIARGAAQSTTENKN